MILHFFLQDPSLPCADEGEVNSLWYSSDQQVRRFTGECPLVLIYQNAIAVAQTLLDDLAQLAMPMRALSITVHDDV
jgi:hypothetical protein